MSKREFEEKEVAEEGADDYEEQLFIRETEEDREEPTTDDHKKAMAPKKTKNQKKREKKQKKKDLEKAKDQDEQMPTPKDLKDPTAEEIEEPLTAEKNEEMPTPKDLKDPTAEEIEEPLTAEKNEEMPTPKDLKDPTAEEIEKPLTAEKNEEIFNLIRFQKISIMELCSQMLKLFKEMMKTVQGRIWKDTEDDCVWLRRKLCKADKKKVKTGNTDKWDISLLSTCLLSHDLGLLYSSFKVTEVIQDRDKKATYKLNKKITGNPDKVLVRNKEGSVWSTASIVPYSNGEYIVFLDKSLANKGTEISHVTSEWKAIKAIRDVRNTHSHIPPTQLVTLMNTDAFNEMIVKLKEQYKILRWDTQRLEKMSTDIFFEGLSKALMQCYEKISKECGPDTKKCVEKFLSCCIEELITEKTKNIEVAQSDSVSTQGETNRLQGDKIKILEDEVEELRSILLCRHRNVQLNYNQHESAAVDETLLFNLQSQARDMTKALTEISDDMCDYIIQKDKIDVAKLVLVRFLNYGTIDIGDEKHGLTKTTIANQERFEKIWIYFEYFYSYFNFEILMECMKKIDYKEGIANLCKYEEKFNEYIKKCTISGIPSGIGMLGNNHQEVRVKLSYNIKTMNAFYLKDLKKCISKILKVDCSQIQLDSVSPGCICLVFHVPLNIIKKVFPLSTHQLEMLKSLKFDQSQLLQISCDKDYQLNTPNQDEWQYLQSISEENGEQLCIKNGIVCSLQNFNEMCSEVVSILHLVANKGNLYDEKKEVQNVSYNPLERDELGNTRLHLAAANSDVSVLKCLLEDAKIDVEATNKNKQTVLHMAAIHGESAVVDYLIHTKKFDVLESDMYGWNSLHYACALGHVEVALLLIDAAELLFPGKAWNHCASYKGFGFNYFHTAIGKGSFDIVKNILHKSKPDSLSLCLAVQHPNMLKLLLNKVFYSPKSKHSALFVASVEGIWESAEILLKKHLCNILVKDCKGDTPLHHAAVAGQCQILSQFIVTSQEPLIKGNNDKTILHYASSHGHLSIVKLIVETCTKSCISLPDLDKITPLHYAALNGHLEIVKYFLDDLKVSPELCDGMDQTPLYYACQGGHSDVVSYLMTDHKCNPLYGNIELVTPLHCASGYGYFEIVKCLVRHLSIQFGSPNTCTMIMESVDSDGDTSLHYAVLNGHVQIVRYYLKDSQMVPDIEGKWKRSPLHIASQLGYLEVVKCLTDEFVCDPLCVDVVNATPLHYASQGGHLDVIKHLTTTKCLMVKDDDGNTPLHYAALEGHLSVVQYYLEEQSIDRYLKGQWGQTALHTASECGHLETAKYLVDQRKCNPLCIDDFGATPLICAAGNDHLEVLKYLANCLSEPSSDILIDSDGDTPLHYASHYCHLDIVLTDLTDLTDLKLDPNITGQKCGIPLEKAQAEAQEFQLLTMNKKKPKKLDSVEPKKTYNKLVL